MIADDLQIRRAEPADVDAIATLAGELGYPSTPAEITARMARLTDRDEVLVAEQAGAVVGWILLAETSSLESNPLAEIRGLVVASSERGRGLGAHLIAAARAWATARGLSRLRVRTNVTRERTHRFYERCGFGLHKEQRVYETVL